MLSNDQKLVAMTKLAIFRVDALLDLFSSIDDCLEGSPKSSWGMTNNLQMLLEVSLDMAYDFHYKIRDNQELSNDQVADCLEQYIKELSNNANNNPA